MRIFCTNLQEQILGVERNWLFPSTMEKARPDLKKHKTSKD